MENFFGLKAHGTSVRTEIVAGLATFLTMAYIIVVNPGILSIGGMPFAGVLTATILVSAISSILMGLFANLPYGVAPGMGINAFFTFTLVLGGVPWPTALGAVFLSGIVFMILSIFKVREIIVKAIPTSLRYAVASGIGLFLALIGLKSVGFIVPNQATMVAFGGLNAQTILFIAAFIIIGWMVMKKVKGALVYGIIGTSIIAIVLNLVLDLKDGAAFASIPKDVFGWPDFSLFLKMDVLGALSVAMILPIFSLVFVDMFDSISTFVGVAEVGGFLDEKTGQPRNVGRALFVDAVATTVSGIFGTSSATTFIESAAGVEEGGRTGLTAVVTGLLFLPFMFIHPLLGYIPAVATAPILLIIGIFMLQPLLKIKWNDFEEALPAFLALFLIPMTYSINMGITWGFLSFSLVKLLRGKAKEVHPALWVIDVFAIISLIFH